MKIISKAILRGGFSLPPIVRCRPLSDSFIALHHDWYLNVI